MNLIKKYFEWDVATWSKAKPYWDEALKQRNYKTAIDIGSRRGGLSLYLAKEHQLNIICSDLNGPSSEAENLHKEYGVNDKISYAAVDCTKMPFENGQFDVVIFKSVIGALGSYELQKKAITEMHRVLKPGGVLLFAENLEASPLHMFLRKKLVKWSSYWRYPKHADMKELLSIFDSYKMETAGFISVFMPEGILKSIAAPIDKAICTLLPSRYRYVAYGYSKK